MIIAIVALLGSLLFASSDTGWLAGVEGRLADHVAEVSTVEALTGQIEHYDKAMRELRDALPAQLDMLAEAHWEHGSTEADFDRVEKGVKEFQNRLFRQDMETRDAFRAALSQAQWVGVFPPDED